ncbi:10778_t:CDS:2, partial [Diversispora eburnea]
MTFIFHVVRAEDNTDNLNDYWTADGVLACVVIILMLPFLENFGRRNFFIQWVLEGSAILIDFFKTVSSLGLSAVSIYRGVISIIFWIIFSILAIKEFEFEKDTLEKAINSASVVVNILNLSQLYVSGLQDIFFYLQIIKIAVTFLGLIGALPFGFYFPILVITIEGFLLYRDSSSIALLNKYNDHFDYSEEHKGCDVEAAIFFCTSVLAFTSTPPLSGIKVLAPKPGTAFKRDKPITIKIQTEKPRGPVIEELYGELVLSYDLSPRAPQKLVVGVLKKPILNNVIDLIGSILDLPSTPKVFKKLEMPSLTKFINVQKRLENLSICSSYLNCDSLSWAIISQKEALKSLRLISANFYQFKRLKPLRQFASLQELYIHGCSGFYQSDWLFLASSFTQL